MFTKILIANRGEIACRVIRTARRLGIRHGRGLFRRRRQARCMSRLADEAVHIGPAPARESYLASTPSSTRAKRTGAAGDPSRLRLPVGERRLSPRPAPTPAWSSSARPPRRSAPWAASRQAKALMEKAGVPLVPGYHGEDQDAGAAATPKPTRIGYPVLIKASAGGGGKGMRVVESAGRVRGRACVVPARGDRSFGDDRVLIEKYVTRPRHVEMQVFADTHGNCRPPVRARLLGPAPPPEGHRGGARARHDAAQRRAPMGEAAVAAATRGRLRRRRHRRVHARRRTAPSTSWR